MKITWMLFWFSIGVIYLGAQTQNQIVEQIERKQEFNKKLAFFDSLKPTATPPATDTPVPTATPDKNATLTTTATATPTETPTVKGG